MKNKRKCIFRKEVSFIKKYAFDQRSSFSRAEQKNLGSKLGPTLKSLKGCAIFAIL